MESSDSEKISTFMSVTSANAERARAYLEANQGDLNAAVAMFMAEGEDDEVEESGSGIVTGGNNAGPQQQPQQQPPPAQASQTRKPPPQQQSQSRFVTMDSLRSRHGHGHSHGGGGSSDSEDDDEGAQAFYVGGSEHGGGQQVLGPPGSRKRPDAGHIATSLFASARQHGATEVPPAEEGAAGSFAAFAGRGLRVDQEPPAAAESAARPQHPQQQGQAPAAAVCRVLKLWSNGISIDNGPLRPFEEPATRELLRAVGQGHVPQELRADARGARVDLQLEDHRDVDYSPPAAPAFRAFAGSGLVLGSPVPPATAVSAPPPAAAAASSATSSSGGGGSAAVPLDHTKPTTQLNVRLPSGGRPLSVSLNHSHTVADLRRYLRAERQDLAGANFVFLTTFPTAEITDESLSLECAGLINAAVLVRIK